MKDEPKRIVKFPASAFREDPGEPVNHEPVKKIEPADRPHSELGGIQHTFRLSIDPWDLQRIIKRANEMGLKGKHVHGFGYDYIGQNLHVVSKE